MTTIAHRTCPFCEAMCGLELTLDDDRHVTLVRGDREDVWSRGYLCPKGTALGRLHEDPDRVRVPLIREGDGFREATWDEALTLISQRLPGIVSEHGRDALAVYIGNPVAHSFQLAAGIPVFVPMVDGAQIYSPGTVDQWPQNVVSALAFGHMWAIPVPDLDRTDHLIVLGGNPSASQGSLMAAPDVLGRLDAIRARGGRVTVVDPRRTGTVDHADEWVPIRPGTDALLLAAMAGVILDEGLADLGRLAPFTDGLDAVREAVSGITPERVAEATGIEATTIRRLARDLAAAPTAAVYGRIGLCTQEFGTLASWLVLVLNVITGNLDRPGGAMFATPLATSLTSFRPPQGFTFGTWCSRVRGAPEVLGQVPAACLAEEIDTPGEGRVRALITIAGNPAVSMPDAGRLARALPQLDFMVSVDLFVNETTRHADVILPGESFLEQPHYDSLIWQFAIRNGGRYSDAVFAPDPDRPREWELLVTLGAIVNGEALPVDTAMWDDLVFGGLVQVIIDDPSMPLSGRDAAEIIAMAGDARGPERMLDLRIRISPHWDHYGERADGWTLARLREHPKGVDLGPLEPRLPEFLATDSGRLELAPDHILADVGRLRSRIDAARDEGLLMIGRRHLRSNNSWLHNVEVLVKGRDRCTLLVHPDDAASRRLVDGGSARITSSAGSVVAPVEVSDEMMRGVVSLPHGWGHDVEGVRLGVASRYPGVNANVIVPGDRVDGPSATHAVNGFPVIVEPA
ncbi:MAG: molybdopterin-dependent oxidoreductase [Actinomycetes bacterium]